MLNVVALKPKAQKIVSQAKKPATADEPAEKTPMIPSAPLWHMGRASMGSQDNQDIIQHAIDYLTLKAKNKQTFTEDEKEFLIEMYEAMWWGGKSRGMGEAALLANHYVHGNGSTVRLGADVYKNSVIVKDSSNAIKQFLRTAIPKSKMTIDILRSYDFTFRRSLAFRSVRQGRRSPSSQGYINTYGYLVAEQFNLRLKYSDNRFPLVANWHVSDKKRYIRWTIDSIYDFEPFKKNLITHLPLPGGNFISFSDGLSNYMVTLNIAKAFKYGADWNEIEVF